MHKAQRFLAILGFAWLFGSSALAGVEVGEKAPPIQPKVIENTNLRSLAALRGKVVLYEFFAFW